MGLGALGSIGGGGGGGSKQQNNAMAQDQLATSAALRAALDKQSGMSQGLIDQGKPLVGQGAGYMTSSADYLKAILGGGAGADKALAGPISDLRTGSQAQLSNLSKFAPRGNVAGQLADRSTQLSSGIARLRYGAQGDAATGLAGIGQGLLSGGTNLQAAGSQGMSGILATLLGKSGQENQFNIAKMQGDQAKWGGLGEGIGNLLGTLLSPGGLLNKSKSSSSTNSSWKTFAKGFPGGL